MSSLSGAHALVVDDSAPLRRQARDVLRALGLGCDEARDGAAAWRMLAAGTYDLVVTDVNMPVLDGLKLIRLVRASPAHGHVPILVLSTEAAQGDRERALALGADAYLVKPVAPEELAAAVRGLLGVA